MNTLLCQSKGEFLKPTHTVITNKCEQAKGILTPHTSKPDVIIFSITILSLHTEFIQILLVFFPSVILLFAFQISNNSENNPSLELQIVKCTILNSQLNPIQSKSSPFQLEMVLTHVKIQTFFTVTLITLKL